MVSDSVQPHRRQPTRFSHPWDSPGKNTGVGCHFLLQCMKVKSEREVAQPLSCVRLLAWTAAYQAPPSMGFSRQKYWSRVPLPSPNKPVSSSELLCCYFIVLLHWKTHCYTGARLNWNTYWSFKILFRECKCLGNSVLEDSNKCWWDGWEQDWCENRNVSAV